MSTHLQPPGGLNDGGAGGQRSKVVEQQRPASEQILGIRFFNGTPAEAVARMVAHGGLLVAPSGTCFERLLRDEEYRTAVTMADLALPDSGAMVVLWRLLQRRRLNRISGLVYLHELFRLPPSELRNSVWVLPHQRSRDHLLRWAAGAQIAIKDTDCYLAPMYGSNVADKTLLELIEGKKPRHIIIGIGAGPQEKLGWLLRNQASSRPAIHCIGGALGFITGDQVAIPDWADRLYLGWFLRLLSNPSVFIPRLTKAAVLPLLIARYGAQLPPLH